MRRAAARLLWRALALLSLALGLVGAVLPVLPTVPFLLLSAWAAGKGWPALETWLLNHAHFGPHVRRWREHGAVPRRAKWLATVMMSFSAVVLAASAAPLAVKIAVPAVMAAVAIWLWRRPER
ncbi:MAG TPA: YbaN family protein [Roseateles sp.]